jgi:hypothetical protein
MRTVQMRFMRLPKPQVKRGQYPPDGERQRVRARARLICRAQNGPR